MFGLKFEVGGLRTAALLSLLISSSAVAEKRPNIVFIMADDQRWDMMSCTGNPYVQTPHLDRIASEGIRFDRAFVNCAVCMPSRAAFFTGRHPHNAGAPTIIHMPYTFHRNQQTFPALLNEAGYHTALFGKWHLGDGDKKQPGFDHWAGYYACSSFHNPLITTNGDAQRYAGYTDFILADMAAEHIGAVAKNKNPFFLFFGLAAPHMPMHYPKEYEHLFDDVTIPKPDSYDEDFAVSGKAEWMHMALGIEQSKLGLKHFKTWDNYVKSYYRSSQSIDEAVGRVIAALDKAGVTDETLIIYTSDHGYSLGEHGLTEKHYSYEASARVPMFVRYPKMIEPGQVREELVSNMDVAPTCLELAGVDIPANVEGLSWKPIFGAGKGDVKDWRDEVFYFLENVHQTVRTERYKYVTYVGKRLSSPSELYDLKMDPTETLSQMDNPEYAEVLAEMKVRMKEQMKQTGLTPRVTEFVRSAHILGPLPADEVEAVVKTGLHKTLAWKKIKTNPKNQLPIAQSVGGEGQFLLKFTVERLSDEDPFARVVFSKKKKPIRGWVNGELLYDRKTKAHPSELAFNNRFNCPLESGINTLVFAGAITDFLNPKIEFWTWEGKTKLGVD